MCISYIRVTHIVSIYDTYTQPGGPGIQSLPLAPRAHPSSFRITRSILMTCDPFYRPFLLPSGGWGEVQDLGAPMAPHSSTLAWKIPWTEEPGRLQSMGSLRVGHD